MIVMHTGGTSFLFYYYGVFCGCLFQPMLPTAVARFFWYLATNRNEHPYQKL